MKCRCRSAVRWAGLALALGSLPLAADWASAAPPLAAAPFSPAEARAHQEAWAAHLRVPRQWSNGVGMKFALIPPGEFTMGSPADEAERDHDEAAHRVRVTRPFYLGVYEVTQGEYRRVMGDNPSWFSPEGNGRDLVTDLDTDRLPVENAYWEHAEEMCRRLRDRDGATYRLPTEAEWEYACRAGTVGPFHFGDVNDGRAANIDGTYAYHAAGGKPAPGPYLRRTAPVGSYPANPFGLHDMHGNVWEWCADWYGANYYDGLVGRTTDDPPGDDQGERKFRVLRGGSWLYDGRSARSAYRLWYAPDYRVGIVGFRLAREL